MMKKYIAIATFSLIGLAGVATAANTVAHHQANEQKSGQFFNHKGKLPRDLQALDLSDKQKEQIKKIIETNRSQEMATREAQDSNENKRAEFKKQMETRRLAEQKLISNKVFDEAAARNMIAEQQAAYEQEHSERKQKMADMRIKRLQERHAIFQILTAKQQKQWLEIQSNRPSFFEHLEGKPKHGKNHH